MIWVEPVIKSSEPEQQHIASICKSFGVIFAKTMMKQS